METQMRSWRPRRPAAGLKQKILARPPTEPTTAWLWGGLTPAMACVVLTLMAINHDPANLGSKPIMAMGMSNDTCANYAFGEAQAAQNHVGVVTFDWTNRSIIKSINIFAARTNFTN
jgi:hypothetical protein